MEAAITVKPGTWNLKQTPRWWLTIVLFLFVCSGANCKQWARRYTEPRTLEESATLAQITTRVNENTAKVQSLQATRASLHIPGVPALRTNLALQTPKRLRMRADNALTGPELDLGSNDELFWLWIRRNQPPAMFVCRHDQFAASSARQIMPVEPQWLIEAIGLTSFAADQTHEGPFPVRGGRLEVRSRQPSMQGDLTKITVIDEWNGNVLEQHLYDRQGTRLASSLTSLHQRDPLTGASLPRSIEVQWPTAEMSFRVDVTDWMVNGVASDNLALWTRPDYEGFPLVDLADPNLRFTSPDGQPPREIGTPPQTPVSLPPAGDWTPLPPVDAPPPQAQQYPPGAMTPLR